MLDTELVVLRFAADTDIYPLLSQGTGDKGPSAFFSFTRTADEISIITNPDHTLVVAAEAQEGHFRAFKVEGPLGFSLTGILASITTPLAEAGISVFTVSTYDTDYILIPAEKAGKVKVVLSKGFEVIA
jgi:hypothetical protein